MQHKYTAPNFTDEGMSFREFEVAYLKSKVNKQLIWN